MISIAIDGPAGAGKSSIAKEVAKKFGIVHIDTGAMYRAIALAVLKGDIPLENEDAVNKLVNNINIKYTPTDNGYRIFLNNADVTNMLRSSEVSKASSIISRYASVRNQLLKLQRSAAMDMSVVMDGRDIGTVVLPNASVKIFLTASNVARAKRRWLENTQNGINQSYENVLSEVIERDKKDTTREIAPLVPAKDAIIIDTTELSFEQSVSTVCRYIEQITDV